ncbi:hypothetical protein [Endozoicomonas sp. 8E]|uniref:hypothetical protein n=1 Tax=Endozoicomonas sp. 8E TaxID=3035692 RepID=UPI002938E92F|nr:hypothetical protein [Endozoicomonas sp. 8E]WOG25728.1 hypothetical protein P6910_14195 [Endozoicomonas sp. 8E]
MILEKLCGQNWPAHLRTSSGCMANGVARGDSGRFRAREVGCRQVEENLISKGVSDITFRSATRGLVNISKSLAAAANSCGKLPDRKVKAAAVAAEFTIKLTMKLVVKPQISSYLKTAVKP